MYLTANQSSPSLTLPIEEETTRLECCGTNVVAKKGILKRHLQPSTSAHKKTVSFQGFVKSFKILHIDDYSERQIRNTWYNEADYKRIRKQLSTCLTYQETGNLKQDDRFFCGRGLEHMSSQGQARRQQQRQNARDAVLIGQALQSNLGIVDEESVAQAYASLTADARRLAQRRGVADELAVSGISQFKEVVPSPVPSTYVTYAA